jgi:dihydrofolate reductase
MRELTADLFLSLDGCAGAKGYGAYFGYDGPELEAWVRHNFDPGYEILMGRVTYQALAAHSSADDEVSSLMRAAPKAVLSNTLHEPLTWANTRLLEGDAGTTIAAMKRETGAPIRTIGSLDLVRSLLRLDLVDRLRLLVFPLILGDTGLEPFFRELPATRLRLLDTAVLDGRLLLQEYGPV